MKQNDQERIIGTVRIQIFDKEGNLKESFEERNLIVDKGRSNMAKLISGSTNTYYIDSIAFGIGTNDPASTDLSITTPLSKSFDSITYPDNNSVAFNWSLGTTEGNGMSITEMGLMSHNGDLFARKTRSAIVKDNTFYIQGSWTLTF